MKKILSIALVVLIALFCGSCSAGNDAESGNSNTGAEEMLNSEVQLPIYPLSSKSKYYAAAADLPKLIYTTSGSENKLVGNVYKFNGTVTGFDEMEMGENAPSIKGFFVETEDGTVIIQHFMGYLAEISSVTYVEMCGDDSTDYTLPSAEETAEFVCLYTGFSGTYDMPIFYYGCDEALVEEIYLDFQVEQMKNSAGSELSTGTNTAKQIEKTEDEATQENRDPTLEQQNALSSAYDYISIMPFSHDGLIEQLEYEGFSVEDATYAADNCGADWNEQAVKSARAYLDIFDYSRSELIDQLVYEGFTYDQAEYGASQNGL